MNDFIVFLWIVAGVVLSVIIPVAVKTLAPTPKAKGLADNSFLDILKPYFKYAFASMAVGFLTLVVVKYTGGQFTSWPQALMAGYLWDSTIQKIKQGLE